MRSFYVHPLTEMERNTQAKPKPQDGTYWGLGMPNGE